MFSGLVGHTAQSAITARLSRCLCPMVLQPLDHLVAFFLKFLMIFLYFLFLGVDTNCGMASSVILAQIGSYDHVIIPGGQCHPTTGLLTNLLNDKYCGTQLNCLTEAPAVTTAATAGTVCTNQRPFKISVKTDDREYQNPGALGEGNAANNRGFSLSNYLYSYDFIFLYFVIRLFYADNLPDQTKWLDIENL